MSLLFNPANAYKLIDPISSPINNIIKFSASTIRKKPEALIKIKIIASEVFSFYLEEVSHIGRKFKNNIIAINTFPNNENSSRRIF